MPRKKSKLPYQTPKDKELAKEMAASLARQAKKYEAAVRKHMEARKRLWEEQPDWLEMKFLEAERTE